jgi:hypothetical protein
MLFLSGKSSYSSLSFPSIRFFYCTLYNEVHNTLIEVYHTDLSDDNAFGFTEVNGDEQLISLHYNLNETDYVDYITARTCPCRSKPERRT